MDTGDEARERRPVRAGQLGRRFQVRAPPPRKVVVGDVPWLEILQPVTEGARWLRRAGLYSA